MLKIRVVGARGLRCDDFNFSTLWNGKRSSDPFCEVRIGGETYQTSVVKCSDEDGHGGTCEWPEEEYCFLIYEPELQTIDVTILDYDMLSGADPLAKRRGIKLSGLLGLLDVPGEGGFRLPAQHHVELDLAVMWAEKAKPGGHGEQTKQAILQTAPPEEHHSILSRLKGIAGEVVKDVSEVTSMAKAAFDKRTGADIEEWKTLESKVEMVVQWTPLYLGSRFRKPPSTQGNINCIFFVGVIMGHQLPTAHDQRYKAKVFVDPCVTAKSMPASKPEENTRETAALPKTQVKRHLTGGSKNEYGGSEDKKRELKRKIQVMMAQKMNHDMIADMLDIPVSYITSEGNEPLDFEYAAYWKEGYYFMLDDPSATSVTIEVFQEAPATGSSKEVETSLGKFTYQVGRLLHLAKEQKFTQRCFRQPLVGDNAKGSKVSVMFQLLTFGSPPPELPSTSTAASQAPSCHVEVQPGRTLTIFQDSTGVRKTQVNGVWADALPSKSSTTDLGNSGTGIITTKSISKPAVVGGVGDSDEPVPEESTMHKALDKVEHVAEGVVGAMGSFAESFFHRKTGSKSSGYQDDKTDKLRKALEKSGLGTFLVPLQDHGIDNVELLRDMPDDELTKVGFKLGHLKKFHIAFPRGLNYLVVCPPGMSSSIQGLGYRASKDTSGEILACAAWGSIVTGVDQGDGWLKVGAKYLPMMMNSYPVLEMTAANMKADDTASEVSSEDALAGTPASKSREGFLSGPLHSMAQMLHLDGSASTGSKAIGSDTAAASGITAATAATVPNIPSGMANYSPAGLAASRSLASTVAVVPRTPVFDVPAASSASNLSAHPPVIMAPPVMQNSLPGVYTAPSLSFPPRADSQERMLGASRLKVAAALAQPLSPRLVPQLPAATARARTKSPSGTKSPMRYTAIQRTAPQLAVQSGPKRSMTPTGARSLQSSPSAASLASAFPSSARQITTSPPPFRGVPEAAPRRPALVLGSSFEAPIV
jgi:hypothetical protein